MGWQQDEIDWKDFQEMKARQRKGTGKGKGVGKGGKSGYGNGQAKGGSNPKVPCLDSRCSAWSYRDEKCCHKCKAPLNKDTKGVRDDNLPSQRRKPSKPRDRSASRRRDASARSERSRSTTKKGGDKAPAQAPKKKRTPSKKGRSGSKAVSYANAQAAMKDGPYSFPDTAEQMEIDADAPSSASLLSAKDLAFLGLVMPSKPLNLTDLLKEPNEFTAPATPAQVVAQAAPCKADTAAATKKAAELEASAKVYDVSDKELAAFIRKRIPLNHGGNLSTETKVTVETMRSKRQDVVVDKEDLVARLEKSRLGAQARHEKLRGALVKERDLLNEKIHAFDERLVVTHAQHATISAQRIGHLSAVLAEWDVVINASAARVEAHLATLTAEPTVQDVSLGSQEPSTGAQASSVRSTEPKQQQQQQQQVMDASAAKANVTATEIGAFQDYFLTAEWDPEVVVGLNPTEGAQRDYLSCLWYQTAAWFKTGLIRITYANLFADPLDATGPMQALRDLLGGSYWDALYGSRAVLASDTVPQQLYHVITSALGCIATSLKEGAEKKGASVGAEMKSKAAGRFNLLKTKAKAGHVKSSKA